jgi:hypothetical protein
MLIDIIVEKCKFSNCINKIYGIGKVKVCKNNVKMLMQISPCSNINLYGVPSQQAWHN